MDGFEARNIMNKFSLFVHTFFKFSNKHRDAAILRFEAGLEIRVVRPGITDVA